MIPAAALVEWGLTHRWPTAEQIEQDLLLSRAICAIADDTYLGNELVFRGGTAFHKLHLPHPLRYSEDLDYVRTTASGIAPLTRALTRLGEDLGFDVNTRVGTHPKVYWRSIAESGARIRLKIEVNTHERAPAMALIRIPHHVQSRWWSGSADVLTFTAAELVSTKLRALFQRSKGRDLFDLWIALEQLNIDPEAILAYFAPYRPPGYTATRAIANLHEKLRDPSFTIDLDPLVAERPAAYEIGAAANLVVDALLARVDDPPKATKGNS